MNTLLIALVAAGAGLLYGAYLIWNVLRAGPENNNEFDELVGEESENISVVPFYMKKENQIMLAVGILITAVLARWDSVIIAIAFVVGAIISSVAWWIGVAVSARAKSLGHKSGIVMGFFVAGIALASVAGFYWIVPNVQALIALSFGAVLVSLFARLSGDIEGPMASDIFATYVASLSLIMFLANILLPNITNLTTLPLLIGAISIGAAIIGSFAGAIPGGLVLAGIISIAAFRVLTINMPFIRDIGASAGVAIFWSLTFGTLIAVFIALLAKYYIGKPSRSMEAVVLPAIMVGAALYGAYWFAGIYGVALSVVSMVSMASMIIVANESGQIIKEITNTFAITTAGLGAIVLFGTFAQKLSEAGTNTLFQLSDARLIIGLTIGSMMPYLLESLAMRKISKAIAVLAPIAFAFLIGFLLGPESLGGFILGAIITGFLFAISLIFGDDKKRAVIGSAINPMVRAISIAAILVATFL
ncbi:MAG: K(+)-insensitive pyrophosphate-energized proton pump [Parcubacteria group bacterium GW2011_GWB1_45_7]|nr:MAG: K(+)-insensitive pyrophosphate-energized proton pump [Parcubacteria group bacterium GW2011_GWB1_45_7]